VERAREHGPEGLPQADKWVETGSSIVALEALAIHILTSLEPPRPRPEATGEVGQVPLEEERPERTIQLGEDIIALNRQSLLSLLREYKDVFAFGPEEMPGIASTMMEHQLKVDPHHRPIIQKKRHIGPERVTAANTEVQKLLKGGLIQECQYLEWILNVVSVKKPNGTWRMCVDFTNLNKAYSKDSYSLPKIDKLLDATSGHALLSFMDAFSGYHQIPLCQKIRKRRRSSQTAAFTAIR